MLSFPSQNDKKKIFSDRPSVLEETDPGDDKPTYFEVWPQQPHLNDITRNFQNLIGKRCSEIFIEIPKILEL